MHNYTYWHCVTSPITMTVRLVASCSTGVVNLRGIIKSVEGVSSIKMVKEGDSRNGTGVKSVQGSHQTPLCAWGGHRECGAEGGLAIWAPLYVTSIRTRFLDVLCVEARERRLGGLRAGAKCLYLS